MTQIPKNTTPETPGVLQHLYHALSWHVARQSDVRHTRRRYLRRCGVLFDFLNYGVHEIGQRPQIGHSQRGAGAMLGCLVRTDRLGEHVAKVVYDRQRSAARADALRQDGGLVGLVGAGPEHNQQPARDPLP